MTAVDPRPRVRAKTGAPAHTDPPVVMEYAEKARFRALANKARRVLPGPVGELVARELDAWQEFGYRIGDRGHALQLATDIDRRQEGQGK